MKRYRIELKISIEVDDDDEGNAVAAAYRILNRVAQIDDDYEVTHVGRVE